MINGIKIEAHGVSLEVTIDGYAPPGILRALRREIREVAFDYLTDVSVTTTVTAEDVVEVENPSAANGPAQEGNQE